CCHSASYIFTLVREGGSVLDQPKRAITPAPFSYGRQPEVGSQLRRFQVGGQQRPSTGRSSLFFGGTSRPRCSLGARGRYASAPRRDEISRGDPPARRHASRSAQRRTR